MGMAKYTAFEFVGEALALDFTNTELIRRRKRVDLLAAPQDLLDWWNAALIHHPLDTSPIPDVDGDTLLAAKYLRAGLRRLFDTVIAKAPCQTDDLETLNSFLRAGYTQVNLTPTGEFVIQRYADTTTPLLLEVALSAQKLLTEHDPDRLRQCQNEHCWMLFYDTTKNANRRWCSTACLNRARSAEHYQHTKGSPGAAT